MFVFFFQAEDGIRDGTVTGVQTCALPILSKVLEEVMVEQYGIQYDLNVCCLRAPWVMEKDDFKYQLSFGDDVFGGPRWRGLVGAEQADAYADRKSVV